MAIKMLDVELGMKVSSSLKDGDMISIVLDGVTHERKLIEHVGHFGLCVQGPTNKLTIPVEMTTLYREGLEKMARTASIPGASRGPGRPRKADGPAAPVEYPGTPPGTPPGGWLPPGSPLGAFPGAGLTQDVATAEQSFDKSKPVEQPAAQPKELPVQLAEDDKDWLEAALDELMDDIRPRVEALIAGMRTEQQAEVAVALPRSVTCFDCEHVDMDGTGKCGKYNIVPPMNVIVDPKAQCPDFVLSVPF